MTKEQAIKWIKDIQNGNFDRSQNITNIPRGKMAVKMWDDSSFSYGMEYGVIMALMSVFDISKDELCK